MKSRISYPPPLKSIHSKIILSIGMIVKNEEKYLDKCLSALQPIRDAVSNELVIVDTGSTDRTVEIARKYTDKVFFFEWINDYAAARNFGLEKCTGEWFMFIDADEIFDDDVSGIVNFFSDKALNKKYNTASVKLQSYTNEAGTAFTADGEFYRICRRDDTLKFEHAVHETVKLLPPAYATETLIHHYGYADYAVFCAKAEKRHKQMCAALEKDPANFRVMYHILQSGIERLKYADLFWENIRRFSLETLDNSQYFAFCLIEISTIYLNYNDSEQYRKCLDIADFFFERYEKSRHALSVTFSALECRALFLLKQYGDCVSAFERYFALWKEYNDGKLDTKNPTTCKLIHFNDGNFEELYRVALIGKEQGGDAAQIEILCAYGDKEETRDTVTNLFRYVCDLEQAVLSDTVTRLNDTQKSVLYNTFTENLSLLVMNLYNPALFNEEDIAVLPPRHLFGYHMSAAPANLEAGRTAEYLRNLRKALHADPSMKHLIEFMIAKLS